MEPRNPEPTTGRAGSCELRDPCSWPLCGPDASLPEAWRIPLCCCGHHRDCRPRSPPKLMGAGDAGFRPALPFSWLWRLGSLRRVSWDWCALLLWGFGPQGTPTQPSPPTPAFLGLPLGAFSGSQELWLCLPPALGCLCPAGVQETGLPLFLMQALWGKQ